MNSLTKDFWKHVSTVGGPSELRDVFLKWAADQHMTLPQAEDIWKLVSADVDDIFERPKNAGDVEVTVKGDPKDVELYQQTISEGGPAPAKENGDGALDVLGKPEDVKPEESKTNEEEKSESLLDFPEEGPSKTSPEPQATGGGTSAPSSGNTTSAVPEQLPI
jgi:hypothetical protein